jgi:NAD(P)-dependent dehydrogenase (short-subunit alcohol dehydrogenase family)
MEIRGRTAIVTGAAAGTGRAIARRLAAEGARVVVADIDRESGERTAREIGGRFVRADMRSPEDVRALIAEAEPQILVNNAGGGGHVPPHFPEADPDEWGATLDLNLRGPMLATQLAVEPMRRQGGGVVVNISSSAGLGTEPYVSPEYGAAKAGLIRFTAALGDLPGVRANCVAPGWILTERAEGELARMTPDERAAAPTPIPLGTVADAVVALIRDDTRSGQLVVLDA